MDVGHCVSVTLNMAAALAVRPEKIRISKIKPAADHNVFQVVVKEIAYFGAHNTFILKASNGQRVKGTDANVSRHDDAPITWDDAVYFWWNNDAGVVLRD